MSGNSERSEQLIWRCLVATPEEIVDWLEKRPCTETNWKLIKEFREKSELVMVYLDKNYKVITWRYVSEE